jgi:PAS domain S-box-containing protein
MLVNDASLDLCYKAGTPVLAVEFGPSGPTIALGGGGPIATRIAGRRSPSTVDAHSNRIAHKDYAMAMALAPEWEHATLQLFQALVEQSPDAMVYAGREGAVLIWNRAAEALFGHTAAEIVGSSMDAIIPERFRAAHWRGFHHAVETGQTRYSGKVLTTRAMHRDGTRIYVDLSFGLVKDPLGAIAGVLAIARDCTERQLAAAALRAPP